MNQPLSQKKVEEKRNKGDKKVERSAGGGEGVKENDRLSILYYYC